MVKPCALIVKGPGTNCDAETAYACESVGFAATVVPIRRLLESPDQLEAVHLFIVPGGFSYGDDIGAGTVFGHELRNLRRPLLDLVRSGRLVFGICNGFQILVKAGLLPDPIEGRQRVTVTYNDSGKFEDRWVRLKVASTRSVFLKKEDVIELPVAHAEGKFVATDENQLDLLKKNGQVVLQYVDAQGRPDGYPANPNGSVDAIAGICDPTGRILGMMPHPERFVTRENHPQWTRGGIEEPHGLRFFRNAYEYLSSR